MRRENQRLEQRHARLAARLPPHLADLAQSDFGVLTLSLPEPDLRKVIQLRKLSKRLAAAQVH